MLRNLSSYYYKDTSLLFCVWIAQCLVHMGKGLLTLNPYHSDRFLLSPYVNPYFPFSLFVLIKCCFEDCKPAEKVHRFTVIISNGCYFPFIFYKTTLAGLITMLYACLDIKTILLGKYTHVLYFVVLATQPRMLLTVDENIMYLTIQFALV
ncbi:26S proteasome non-ATPase regulatory subunit protein A [Trifolium repens]|nr:26S proteasome non-ATPase regulatory subunit protein A [Trifolium repens]